MARYKLHHGKHREGGKTYDSGDVFESPDENLEAKLNRKRPSKDPTKNKIERLDKEDEGE